MKTVRRVLTRIALLVALFAAHSSFVEGQTPEGPAAAPGGPEVTVRVTLDEALDTALEGSRELEQARLALSQADGQVAEAWADVYPQINLNTSYTRNLSPAVSFLPAIFFDPDAEEGDLIQVQFGAENVWGGSISLEQPLFRASVFIGLGAADRFQALQQETARGTEQDVLTRVRLLYYELLLAQEQASLLTRSLDRVGQSVEETRALNRAGLSSDYDLLRLEVELANLEPDLRRADNEVRRLRRDMAVELGLEPGTVVEVVGSLAALNLESPTANTPDNAPLLARMGVAIPDELGEEQVTSLLERTSTTNSRLQQAGLNTALANTQLQLERAEYLPELSLFATYDVQAQHDGAPRFFGGSSGQRGYGRNVGLRFTLPVFTGFRQNARIDQMQANLRVAEVELDLAQQQVGNELRTLLERTEEARLRARGQSLAVEQARRGFEIASAQYREGLGSQLELTDAEVALTQSEFNYAQAVYDYLSNRARIDQLVGAVPMPGGV
jgi:outer membrane protein TolC